MRKTWLGPLGLFAVAVACGETGKLSPTNHPPSGGEGGEATPSAGTAGDAGANDLGGSANGASGGAAGESGAVGGASQVESAAGAGGAALDPLPGYSLTLVPPFEPPAGSKPPVAGELTPINLVGMSRDGSRIFGTTSVAYAGGRRDELLTWTAATGSVRVPLPDVDSERTVPYHVCVADDGSAAFFARSQDDRFDLFHWTPEAGAVALPAIDGVAVSDTSCNRAATLAAFVVDKSLTGEQELRVWQSGQNGDTAKLVPWPLAEHVQGRVTLSLQGDRGLINAFTSDAKVAPYSWSVAGGSVGLGVVGDDCRADLISEDGSTLVGSCGSGVFRWTAPDGHVALGSFSPYFLSEDAQTLWGMRFFPGQPKNELVVVRPGQSSAETIALPKGNERIVLTSATADGKTAYFNLNPVGGPRRAARYELDGELEPLELLPGYAQNSVSMITRDGVLAAGSATHDELDFGRAVIWDAQGARDVLAELKQGQVDVSRISHLRIAGIWLGQQTVRVEGYCLIDEQISQLFFAELPVR